jgi:hypothetical protein
MILVLVPTFFSHSHFSVNHQSINLLYIVRVECTEVYVSSIQLHFISFDVFFLWHFFGSCFLFKQSLLLSTIGLQIDGKINNLIIEISSSNGGEYEV